MPMRHLTVTGTVQLSPIAATRSATSSGSRHQAGAEPPRLHAVRRAADIEIDLVVAELGADARGLGELRRIAAANLQGDGMLIHVELEQPLPVAAQHRVRRHHLGVEQRVLAR